MAETALQLIEANELPDYPIPTGERLDSHFFIPWHHRRWLHSEFRLLADLDVRAVGFDLFCVAQEENPVGTLPTDERLLAKLVGLPLDVWQTLCERSMGPLHGWQPCLTDKGVRRLFHPVVLQVAEDALGRRADQLDKREGERERKRMEKLPDQMVRAGARPAMTQDPELLAQFDQFLLENYGGKQRRPNVVRAALEAFSIARAGQD